MNTTYAIIKKQRKKLLAYISSGSALFVISGHPFHWMPLRQQINHHTSTVHDNKIRAETNRLTLIKVMISSSILYHFAVIHSTVLLYVVIYIKFFVQLLKLAVICRYRPPFQRPDYTFPNINIQSSQSFVSQQPLRQSNRQARLPITNAGILTNAEKTSRLIPFLFACFQTQKILKL